MTSMKVGFITGVLYRLHQFYLGVPDKLVTDCRNASSIGLGMVVLVFWSRVVMVQLFLFVGGRARILNTFNLVPPRSKCPLVQLDCLDE